MKKWLSERIDGRVTITVVAGVIVASCMVLLGMEPRLVIVGFIVMIVGAVSWLAVDLGPLSAPLVWSDRGRDDDRAPRADRRVAALETELRRSPRRRRASASPDADSGESDDKIGDSLVGIIDGHLAAEFNIDRERNPAGAAEALGADLTRFVTDPSTRQAMTGRRNLARTVALVEDLCSRTHARSPHPTPPHSTSPHPTSRTPS